MCFVLAKLLQNLIDHVIKTSSPLMLPFFKKVFGLAVWQSYFIWRWAVLFKFVGEKKLDFCKQNSAETCKFPSKVNYTPRVFLQCAFSDWGTIHSSLGWFCNAFNYLYSSRSLVRKRAQRHLLGESTLSPLFSGGRKHTVCPAFLPAGSDLLTKGAISAHCDNDMKRTKASPSNSEIQAFGWTGPGRTEKWRQRLSPPGFCYSHSSASL